MVYCVEDDENIRELVVYTLAATGFEARGFENAESLYAALNDKPDLVLLDIMLPDEDGLSVLKKLKAMDIPVIMVTAKGTEYDKVLGLDGGADDYVAKPFGMMELVSRIKAVLRRVAPKESPGAIIAGGIELSEKHHAVKVLGREIELTLKEFELLRHLMQNPGIVLTRDALLQAIWGYDFDGETRTVDVHVRTLRQKLGESGAIIQTVRGVGYKIGEMA